MTAEQQHKSKTTKTATAAKSKSEEDWCMLPDVEDIEKIVNRELKKLEEYTSGNTQEK